MAEPEHSFLSRWSRRKAQVRQGGEPAAPAALAAELALPAADSYAPPSGVVVDPAAGELSDTSVPPEPGPTLEDVQALTPESDFSRFVARDVDPEVKNLALKKLFTDPHFNVMDGLDTYIDDYNTPDPIPKAMFRQLVQARMLGLLDDELEDQVQTPTPAIAAAEPACSGQTVPPAADSVTEKAAVEPAVACAGPNQAVEMKDMKAVADGARGGRAWESNPPGTA